MIRRLIVLAVLALAAAPAAALAGNQPSGDVQTNASRQCTALRARLGATTFAQAYTSFGACVSKLAPLEQNNLTSANTLCQAEQADASFASAHGGKTFVQFYGTGKQGKDAFGKCVSGKARSSSAAEQAATPNPAQTCRAERTRIGVSAFTTKYRTFGKCVSQAARAALTKELSASAQCRAAETNAAAFAQTYGDDANAFGTCVSTKAKS